MGDTGARIVRVLPDVTGLDKAFDYSVPAPLAGMVELGDLVRVDLHGRRVRGWVVQLDPDDAPPDRALLELVRWSSRGPDGALIELAEWASVRWAAGRLRPFLIAATPPTNVTLARDPRPDQRGHLGSRSARSGVTTLRLGPTVDPLPVVIEQITGRRALVIHPSISGAKAVARRLSRAGFGVALWPEQWAGAAGGVDVTVGTRGAAWARIPGLEVIVVLDEHDEALQSERSPTWHAREVVVERATRIGAECVLISPAPTPAALAAAGGAVSVRGLSDELASWPMIEVVDRSGDPPWKRSLLSSRLIEALRDPDRRVVCVLNTPGRARRLACRSCRSLVRCAVCEAAVSQAGEPTLHCARCQTDRPPVCQACGSTALANVRPGVARLAEELQAAAGRAVVTVTGNTEEIPDAGVYVGTEAVLHRLRHADVVAFLDFDAELLAPRYRATEQALTLLIRAARLVGRRAHGGRVLVQTHLPDHELLRAVRLGELGKLGESELRRRAELGLPPAGALARISGHGHADVARSLAAADLHVALGEDHSLVRAAEWLDLGRALNGAPRPTGGRLRIEVDPPR